MGVKERGGTPLTGLEDLQIVGHHSLEKAHAVTPRDLDLSNQRAVDQSRGLPDRPVFPRRIAIMGRHLPPAAVIKDRAEPLVDRVECQLSAHEVNPFRTPWRTPLVYHRTLRGMGLSNPCA